MPPTYKRQIIDEGQNAMTVKIFSELKNEFPEKFSKSEFDENSELKEMSDSLNALRYKSRIEDARDNWQKIDEVFREIQIAIDSYQRLQREKQFIEKEGSELRDSAKKYDIFMNISFLSFTLACIFNILPLNILIFSATAIVVFYLHHKLRIQDFFAQTTILNAIYNFEINRICNDIGSHGFHEKTLERFTKYRNSIYERPLSKSKIEKSELILEIQESILQFDILKKINPDNDVTENENYRSLINHFYLTN
jgi:hypothetical protein